jgi:hypothetical protein
VSHQVFLLSPAHCGGKRAGLLIGNTARSALAQRLRSGAGAPIGEVFSFMSGLYFRGKLAYGTAFAHPPPGCAGVHVIVPGWGLRPATATIDFTVLRAIAAVPVDPLDARYVEPLRRDAARLAERLGAGDAAVLLGSIATTKYIEPLQESLGSYLRVPREFVGLGDMSRGALMLQRVAARSELEYVETYTLSRDVSSGSRRA